jgi:hypothetical protein
VHGDKTQADDEAVTVIEFEGNAFGIIENSWQSSISRCTFSLR